MGGKGCCCRGSGGHSPCVFWADLSTPAVADGQTNSGVLGSGDPGVTGGLEMEQVNDNWPVVEQPRVLESSNGGLETAVAAEGFGAVQMVQTAMEGTANAGSPTAASRTTGLPTQLLQGICRGGGGRKCERGPLRCSFGLLATPVSLISGPKLTTLSPFNPPSFGRQCLCGLKRGVLALTSSVWNFPVVAMHSWTLLQVLRVRCQNPTLRGSLADCFCGFFVVRRAACRHRDDVTNCVRYMGAHRATLW